MRCFLTVPLFGIAAALLLSTQGTEGLTGRWTPTALAVTHLLTLGYLSMTATGALFQIFPVVLGIEIPGGQRLAGAVHLGLSLGSALLAAGLLLPETPLIIQLGLGALALAFASFLGAAAWGVLNLNSERPVLRSMHFALAGHVIVVLLGLFLALGHAGVMQWSLGRNWTDLHAVWGLGGWLGILVMGVAYEVVPMFQQTPPYPERMKRQLGPAVAGALTFWSIAYAATRLGGEGFWVALGWVAGLLLATGFILFATVTLYLQSKRKSRDRDISVYYWAFGMLSLIAGILGMILASASAGLPAASAWNLSASILLLLGFAVSVTSGMLHKIVPFLVWLHLTVAAQAGGRSRREVPNVKRILPKRPAWIHLALHCLGVILLTLLPFARQPFLLWTAALSLAIAFAILGWTIYSGARVYQRSKAAWALESP